MKPVYVFLLSLLAVSSGLGGDARGQQEVLRLSLDEALEIADSTSYQVQIALSRLSEAGGKNLESWKAFLPRFTISEDYVRSDNPVFVFGTKLKQGVFTQEDFNLNTLNNPDPITNWETSFSLQQPILNMDAIFGKTAAGSAKKASELSLQRTKETIALEVKRAYYGLILANASLKTIERSVAAAEANHREAEASFQEGLVSEADVLSALVRLGELEEQRLIAMSAIDDAGEGLAVLMGLEGDQRIVPTDTLAVVALPVPSESANETPVDRADLLALQYQEKATHRSLWMRRSEWIPRINAFGDYQWNDPEPFGQSGENWMVGVLFEWNVLDGLGTWGRTQQARAQQAAVRAQYREAVAKSRVEIRKAVRAVNTAKQRVDVAQTAVDRARASLRIVEARFQEGMERMSEVISIEAAYTNAQLRLIRAKHDLNVAQGELKFYRGTN